ncbi:MAG: hypothetical protein ACLVEJ_10160 [Parabacteroides sp.]
MLNKIIRYFLENRATILLLLVVIWGISMISFQLARWYPCNPILVDAIPDTGDNQ